MPTSNYEMENEIVEEAKNSGEDSDCEIEVFAAPSNLRTPSKVLNDRAQNSASFPSTLVRRRYLKDERNGPKKQATAAATATFGRD